MADKEDKDRAKRLAGRFTEEETDKKAFGVPETKVMSMKIPEPLHNKVQEKFEEIFVTYVKKTESHGLKKQDFYEALIRVGIDNLKLEDLKKE